MATVDKFKGTAISDKIGKVKVKPVRLEYEQGFQPWNGVIKDVDPREPIDCILNIALSEKKNKDIRMNIDVRPTRGPRCQDAKKSHHHSTRDPSPDQRSQVLH